MRTLMIVEPGLRLWGSERALAATLGALCESWARVVLITPPESELASEVLAHPDRYSPVEVEHAPIGSLRMKGRAARVRAGVALAFAAWRLRPSKVYINQAGLARMMRPVCQALGLPMVVHVRLIDDLPQMSRLKGSARSPIDWIAVSRAMLSEADFVDTPHSRMHVAYDPYILAVPPSDREGIDRQAFVSVGRLSYLKGVHLLVDALFDSRLSDAKVAIYGAGVEGDPYADDLAKKAQPLGECIVFEGFAKDVQLRLPGHRFLVLTSAYETLGRVVVEAWDAGLVPIVFAGSGGAAEIVAASGGGLTFESWTSESLASTLNDALLLPENERRAIAARGRSWATEALDLDTYQAALRGVLF